MQTHLILKETVEVEAHSTLPQILAQAGYLPSTLAHVITWGGLAETIEQSLAEVGISPEYLDESALRTIAQNAIGAVEAGEHLTWRERVRLCILLDPAVVLVFHPPDSDDEGPLTEAYENATRLGDDDAYWVDGGVSADLFDEG